jgi:hypothetical protein
LLVAFIGAQRNTLAVTTDHKKNILTNPIVAKFNTAITQLRSSQNGGSSTSGYSLYLAERMGELPGEYDALHPTEKQGWDQLATNSTPTNCSCDGR